MSYKLSVPKPFCLSVFTGKVCNCSSCDRSHIDVVQLCFSIPEDEKICSRVSKEVDKHVYVCNEHCKFYHFQNKDLFKASGMLARYIKRRAIPSPSLAPETSPMGLSHSSSSSSTSSSTSSSSSSSTLVEADYLALVGSMALERAHLERRLAEAERQAEEAEKRLVEAGRRAEEAERQLAEIRQIMKSY